MSKQPINHFSWNLGVGFVVFFMIGFYADKHYGTGFKYTIIGLIVACVYFIYEVWKMMRSSK